MASSQFSDKKRNAITQPCDDGNGSICVIATRADTRVPMPRVDVTVSGPTPGQCATSPKGVSQFDERRPGAYTLAVTLGSAQYKKWVLLPYSKALSVSRGQVTIAEVHASPTGTLKVEIWEENGPLVHGEADVRATGPSSFDAVSHEGVHTFPDIPHGKYDVSARLPARYDNETVTATGVVVPENGIGIAKLVVRPRTWIEIELKSEDDVEIADEEYCIVAPDGREIRGKTDARGRARVEGIVPGSCRIRFPRLHADDWGRV